MHAFWELYLTKKLHGNPIWMSWLAVSNKDRTLLNALCLGRRSAPIALASTIVKSVVISKIDYGSFIYGLAKKCLLKELDTTLHSILQRAPSGLKSTPIAAMYCEVGIQSLRSREKYPLARYFAKKIRLGNHIIHKEIISHHNPDVCFKPTWKS